MSTSPPPGRALVSEQPAGCAHLAVTDMARSLGFYLDLGCEVRCAADGWVLLHSARTSFVLALNPATVPDPSWRSHSTPPQPAPPPLRLSAPDLRALRRRLLAAGIGAGTIIRPTHAPGGEIEIIDPDRRLVVVEQFVPGPVLLGGSASSVHPAQEARQPLPGAGRTQQMPLDGAAGSSQRRWS